TAAPAGPTWPTSSPRRPSCCRREPSTTSPGWISAAAASSSCTPAAATPTTTCSSSPATWCSREISSSTTRAARSPPSRSVRTPISTRGPPLSTSSPATGRGSSSPGTASPWTRRSSRGPARSCARRHDCAVTSVPAPSVSTTRSPPLPFGPRSPAPHWPEWTRSPAEGRADPVQVPERLRPRPDQPGLVIRHADLFAVAADDRLGPAQMRHRQMWEEVVLDLVVQPAHEVVDHDPTADVAGRQHLLTQEVELLALLHRRHALVSRCEHRSHVDTPECLVHNKKRRGLARGEHQQQRTEIRGRVHREQRRFGGAVGESALDHRSHARDVQVEPLQRQQREE